MYLDEVGGMCLNALGCMYLDEGGGMNLDEVEFVCVCAHMFKGCVMTLLQGMGEMDARSWWGMPSFEYVRCTHLEASRLGQSTHPVMLRLAASGCVAGVVYALQR